MTIWMIILFVLGYLLIALEHPLKIDKAATALLMGVLLWLLYLIGASDFISDDSLRSFISDNPQFKDLPLWQQYKHFVSDYLLIESLGGICSILIFLLGAMTIVEVIDVHGGFIFITSHVTTNNKRKLLWIVTLFTFFMSAVLDNLTTAIVMIMLTRKLLSDKHERWLFASLIVIAANSGGAWSPIGDVTTIMLWINGNVTTGSIIPRLFLPGLVSVLVPAMIISYKIKLETSEQVFQQLDDSSETYLLPSKKRKFIFFLGISALLFVPIFKAITHFPPFIGILLGLSALWITTEIMYNSEDRRTRRQRQQRVGKVIRRLDGSTLLFFLGILLAVDVLSFSGILSSIGDFLYEKVGNIYAINLIIGAISAVLDNVPLVAGAMRMYPLLDASALAIAANPEYMQYFVQDGVFWHFLAYCGGVGGSMLIIGSAAGVVAMAIEQINFIWYLKRISLLALAGYLLGALVYILQTVVLRF